MMAGATDKTVSTTAIFITVDTCSAPWGDLRSKVSGGIFTSAAKAITGNKKVAKMII
jgi:hypothetical protein